jgi:hypothetical protein
MEDAFMFGSYEVPLSITQEKIALSIKKEEETLRYKRECNGEKVEKVLLTDGGKILVNPVEPVNKPKELTPYLFIELGSLVVVEPKSTQTVFLKFPIEIGIFISKNENFEVLDILSLMKQKFTLYGDPRNGFICRYFKSEVHSTLPRVDPICEGVLELTMTNTTPNWVDVTKAIFNAYGMKIYYNDHMVSMKANMKIRGNQIAENDFVDAPLEPDMKKSLELYTARKLLVTGTKFTMELGI